MAGKFKLLSFLWLVVACLVLEPSDGATTTTTPTTTTTTLATTTTTTTPTTTAPPGTTTTAVPTTTAPPGTTTTAGPTTTAPPGTTTTAGPTTTAPPGTTTTAPPGTTTTAGPTTTAPPGTTTTAGPTTTAPPGTTTTAAPVPTRPAPCDINPCGQGSTCEARAGESFVCLCLPGDNYNYGTKSCENAKVFPGQLTLPGLTYDDKMENKTSIEFKNTTQTIVEMLNDIYNESGYSNSTVLELKPIQKSNAGPRSDSVVIATVEIIFNANSEITTQVVGDRLTQAANCEGLLKGATFNATDLCSQSPCDKTTANCSSANGSYNCACNTNYIKTDFSSRICIACPSGKRTLDSLTCVNCPFGYSGFNCTESWQLALVIVGSVLGGLLLIALILLPVLALKPPKKRSKKNKNADMGNYVTHSPVKAPLVNSSLPNSQAPSLNGLGTGSAGVPRIPRATTTSSWDSRTNLEMSRSSSRQNLTPVGRNSRLHEDQDSLNPYTQSRPQSSLYAQARPQSNPYAQNRPQVNPYAQNQGQTNPYYLHDDGRRSNY